jgi:hypothetical protein
MPLSATQEATFHTHKKLNKKLNFCQNEIYLLNGKLLVRRVQGGGGLAVTSFLVAVSCLDGHQLQSDNFLAVSQVPVSYFIFHGTLKMIIKQNVSSKYNAVWLKEIFSSHFILSYS